MAVEHGVAAAAPPSSLRSGGHSQLNAATLDGPMGDLNCHFVSRFLTRPWEFGEKQLHFVDFSSETLEHKSSRNLFAAKGLNDAATEHRLSDVIETPLARFVNSVRMPDWAGPAEINDWKVFRALALLMPAQVARLSKLERDAEHLDRFCRWSDAELDQFAHLTRQEFEFRLVAGHPGMPLFYPSHGFFVVATPGASDVYPGVFLVPITARIAVAAIQKQMDSDLVMRQLERNGGAVVSNSSVGTIADRVIIHPSLVGAAPVDEMVRELRAVRDNNLTLINACAERIRLINEAFSVVGGRPTGGCTGRTPPRSD